MAAKDKSLLELAIEVVSEYKKPMDLKTIAKEAMEKKGLKTEQGRELMTRFICDFMESGYFIYCDNGLWDLKERQPLSVINKDISDYSTDKESEAEVKNNELNVDTGENNDEPETTTDDDNDVTPEEDDIAAALGESNSKSSTIASADVELGYDEDDEEDE